MVFERECVCLGESGRQREREIYIHTYILCIIYMYEDSCHLEARDEAGGGGLADAGRARQEGGLGLLLSIGLIGGVGGWWSWWGVSVGVRAGGGEGLIHRLYIHIYNLSHK